MTKGEIFAIGTGIVGLIADAITIADKIEHHPSQPGFSHDESSFLLIFSVAYAWFILAWFLAKWKYSRQLRRKSKETKLNLVDLTRDSVFVVGAMILPFSVYIGYSLGQNIQPIPGTPDPFMGVFASLGITSCVGLILWAVLNQGLPLIYDEFD